MPICAQCDHESEGAKFCPECGAPLVAPAREVVEERRVVTALFCDLVGFTASSESADPEDVNVMLAAYSRMARAQIEGHGGVVEKFIGDAVVDLPLSGYPQDISITPNGETALIAAAAQTDDDAGTSIIPLDLSSWTPGAAMTLPRTNDRCDPTTTPGVCIPAPVTITVMPDGRVAYAGIAADSTIIPIGLPSLSLGSGVTLPGQLGIARPVPAQAPTAAFKTKLAAHGSASTFDGSASASPNGTVTSWSWNFGDGAPTQTTATPLTKHIYTSSGSYTVTLIVTDSSGVSTTIVASARQLLRNGGPTAKTQLAVTIK